MVRAVCIAVGVDGIHHGAFKKLVHEVLAGLVEDLGPEVLIHGAFTHAPDSLIRIRAQKGDSYGATNALAQARSLNVTLSPAHLLFFDAEGQRLTANMLEPVEAV